MCECKSNLEERLLKRVSERFPDATDIKLQLDGYSFLMGEGKVTMKPTMPIVGEYKQPTKKGGQRVRKIKEQMIASYCPFCGESLKEAEQEPEKP